jgi:uncharacterized protein YqjF (DUF2071 family)
MPSPLTDLAAAYGQHASASLTEHRPWPIRESSWLMGQSWFDLLFAHWRMPPEVLRPVVPPQLEIDVADGAAWVGVTPFEVRAFRLRFTLPVPFLSAFPELNVRTYVVHEGRPGIYFISLDATSRLAVSAARRVYRFPYFRARMAIDREAGAIGYRSRRTDDSGPPATLSATYEPTGPGFNAAPDSLDWFLVERYCAYTLDERGRVLRAEIHHRPWELHRVTAEITENSMGAQIGLDLGEEPLLHYSPRQDVIIWPHEPASR